MCCGQLRLCGTQKQGLKAIFNLQRPSAFVLPLESCRDHMCCCRSYDSRIQSHGTHQSDEWKLSQPLCILVHIMNRAQNIEDVFCYRNRNLGRTVSTEYSKIFYSIAQTQARQATGHLADAQSPKAAHAINASATSAWAPKIFFQRTANRGKHAAVSIRNNERKNPHYRWRWCIKDGTYGKKKNIQISLVRIVNVSNFANLSNTVCHVFVPGFQATEESPFGVVSILELYTFGCRFYCHCCATRFFVWRCGSWRSSLCVTTN